MEKKRLKQFIPVLLFAGIFMAAGPVCSSYAGDDSAKAANAQQKEENVLKGKIAGKSKKAQTITIMVGKGDAAKPVMVKFDENTKGLEHAEKDEAAIIKYEQRGDDKVAVLIKQKLAKLPEGVVEIQPEEMVELIAMGPEKGKFVLIDSRPGARYAEGHLPYALSVPVAKLKDKKEAALPADKDIQLIFYCGGVT